jgi:hypothetical protein
MKERHHLTKPEMGEVDHLNGVHARKFVNLN